MAAIRCHLAKDLAPIYTVKHIAISIHSKEMVIPMICSVVQPLYLLTPDLQVSPDCPPTRDS